MISGHTEFIAHIGWPTHAFKAPLIYNPHFEQSGIDAVVLPMGCRSEHYPAFLRAVFTLENIRGALITMPHKVATVGLLAAVTPTVQIAGACNAVRRGAHGRLEGASALVVGCGGVGSAIAASLAAAGVAALGLFDTRAEAAVALGARLAKHYPNLRLSTGSNDPAGHELVVNATPMGMNEGDALPMDVSRIEVGAFVGEVVMTTGMTAFLQAAKARGCRVQVGADMLFEQIPAYLEFFGFPTTTAEALRAVARLGD